MLFINKPDFSRDLNILMISFISSFEIINVSIRESKTERRGLLLMLLLLVLMVNPIKTLLPNGLSIFPNKSNAVYNNGNNILPENPPDCAVLCN